GPQGCARRGPLGGRGRGTGGRGGAARDHRRARTPRVRHGWQDSTDDGRATDRRGARAPCGGQYSPRFRRRRMKYVRMTSASIRDALGLAKEILLERLPLEVVSSDAHSLTLRGGD